MTTKTESTPQKSFVTSLLPWLLTAGMFLLYLLTLDHWVSPDSLFRVGETAGWNWRPSIWAPVTFLFTCPFRLLPASSLPVALNLFSAVCAALTLGCLARCVSLLPHDRTYDERQREQSESSRLSIPTAWVPPLFAVLVLGLQITFWENAIEATNEMFDLLLFAYVIRCLLEYRLEHRESWLVRFALAYGLAMADNWAMVCYFPAFLVALVWIKGLAFFDRRFLLRTAICGLAGFSLILLLPLTASLSDVSHLGFFQSVGSIFGVHKYIITSFSRSMLLLLSLTSILPVFVIGIRWPSYFGDPSPIGTFLATSTFHFVHGLFLVACLWVSLDSPFSPRHFGGLPFLTFYFLGALSIGYFSGYFLLVFGSRVAKSRERVHPVVLAVNRAVVAGVWFLVIAVPSLLVYRNLPRIQSDRASVFARYFSRIEAALPSEGAVVLSDDPNMLAFLRAACNRTGKAWNNLLIETSSLTQDPAYFHYLDQHYPQYRLASLAGGNSQLVTNAVIQLGLLKNLSDSHDIYYLHPSFGYYFEEFYVRPHGLVYRLKLYPPDSALPPPLSPEEIDRNLKLWKGIDAEELPRLTHALKKTAGRTKPGVMERFFASAHLAPETDQRALMVAGYYSRALDYWGVELQQSGLKNDAEKCFEQAKLLNPDNVAAQINYDFNQDMRKGAAPVVLTPKEVEEKLGKHRTWLQAINEDGPVDEPNFHYELGSAFEIGSNYRQALQQFERARILQAQNTNACLKASQSYLRIRDYSNALAAAEQVLETAPDNPDGIFLKSVSLIQLQRYDQAIPPLNRLLELQTNHYAAQLNRAIAYLKVGNLDASRKDYESVARVAPKAYQVYYGLGEIAYRQKDTPAAIKNYQLYLTNAPPQNPEEVKFVSDRLKELKSGAP